jgi:hypothetical protein
MAMDPLTSTLADLTAAKLIAYATAALPPPVGTLQVPSTDPNVFAGNTNYLKLLMKQADWHYGVDVPNLIALDGGKINGGDGKGGFVLAADNWEEFGKPTAAPPPAFPSLKFFDESGFDLWWTQYTAPANQGQDAPPLFFIKPVPALPALVILEAGSNAPPPPPALDGPIGAAVPMNPTVYSPSAADNAQQYPDAAFYAGLTGIYQKHIYSNPFTVNQTRVVWIKLN